MSPRSVIVTGAAAGAGAALGNSRISFAVSHIGSIPAIQYPYAYIGKLLDKLGRIRSGLFLDDLQRSLQRHRVGVVRRFHRHIFPVQLEVGSETPDAGLDDMPVGPFAKVPGPR